jgi:putative two-component system response regulator
MYCHADTIGESVTANKIIYIGGSFLQFFILLSILNLCRIKVRKITKLALFSWCAVMYGSVLTIGYRTYFYKTMTFTRVNGVPVLERTYGFMHQLFFTTVILFFASSLAVIIYTFFKKKQVSRSIIYLLLLPDLVCIVSYFMSKRLSIIDIIPVAYIFAQVMYLLIAYRVSLYDIDDTAIDSLVQTGNTGFITFDFKLRYLGSNGTARKIIPGLNELSVDSKLSGTSDISRQLQEWLGSFAANERNNEFIYTIPSSDPDAPDDEKFYIVSIDYLYGGIRKRGYMVTLTDDTQNRKYIRLLDHYNDDLKSEVDEKTRHIIEMHDNLIMSLAAMVESRDNSTGGHIKRTSVGVRILIEEILRDGKLKLTDDFCRNIIKAAPMHDLGKIAVDDAVLRKPGRFTPEEFEKMKHHSAEGARVIHEILLKTDDESFKHIAENIAHYHHERWDGSGYPDSLQGEKIPLEARIMAVADVYDALVSKRVYKASMSFEKADRIMMEGMGTQFAPEMKDVYVRARPKLEAYYSSQEQPENGL